MDLYVIDLSAQVFDLLSFNAFSLSLSHTLCFVHADYYCYCEVGFTTRTLGGESLDVFFFWSFETHHDCEIHSDHIITFMREGNQSYGCDIYE